MHMLTHMSLSQRSPLQIVRTAVAVVSLGFGAAMLQACSEPDPTTQCLDDGNVWVLVEFDDGVQGGCATEFADGFEALNSAGFTAAISDDGFLNTIDGEPSTAGDEDWWAYAHSDPDLTAWEFYEVGGNQSEPVAGSIEGWRLMHSFDAEDTSPRVSPADLVAGE